MINFGKSGAPPPVISRARRPQEQPGGPVAATMGLVSGLRGRSYRPRLALQLGLLSKAPTPEGHGWVEVEAENYARQPFVLAHGPVSNGHVQLLNRDLIVFGPCDLSWPVVTHIAALDPDGDLHAYGAVVSAEAVSGPFTALEFKPARLILRYRHM